MCFSFHVPRRNSKALTQASTAYAASTAMNTERKPMPERPASVHASSSAADCPVGNGYRACA